jgi:ATP-dependent exoDNAse (exonuclease V) alpha subunit
VTDRNAALSWSGVPDVAEAIARLTKRGNVVEGDNADVLRGRLVADWREAVDRGEVALMLARRRVDVADLNARARQALKADGYLDDTTETAVAGLALCEGDWVLARRNNRRLGVHNGDLGVVARVDDGAITVVLDRGPTVALPSEYVAAGHLDYGYALTVHKAQGATCDRTYVLGDDSLAQELGYTAMSRGRKRNQLYVMAPDAEQENPGGHDTVDHRRFDLVEALRRSEAQVLASDLLPDRERATARPSHGIAL